MTTLEEVLAPTSDQLNADDLITGPRTITITRVTLTGSGKQAKANVYFEGDNGKPWKACKTTARNLVAAWGKPAEEKWPGHRVTLYRDPTVPYEGKPVGGIRVSHISGIDKPLELMETVTRGKRQKVTYHPLPDAPPPFDLDRLLTAIRTCSDREAAMALAKAAGVPGGMKKQVMGVIEEVFPGKAATNEG